MIQGEGATTPLSRLRATCLALPEALERETWGAPTFRVREKIFAMVHQVKGAPSFWCKAPPGAQAILVEAAPERFFVPPYVGHKGWIGVWLNTAPNGTALDCPARDCPALDWSEVDALVRRSYAMTAPRKLLIEAGISNPADKSVARSLRRSPPSPAPKRPRTAASGH